MGFLFQFVCGWVSLSVLIIATSWYLTVTIAARWPEWWKQIVVDLDPYDAMTIRNQPDDGNISSLI